MRMAFLFPGDRETRPVDDVFVPLIVDYAKATTPQETKASIDAIQRLWYDYVPLIYLGEWFSIFPARNEVKDFSVPAFPIYTNVWLDR